MKAETISVAVAKCSKFVPVFINQPALVPEPAQSTGDFSQSWQLIFLCICLFKAKVIKQHAPDINTSQCPARHASMPWSLQADNVKKASQPDMLLDRKLKNTKQNLTSQL